VRYVKHSRQVTCWRNNSLQEFTIELGKKRREIESLVNGKETRNGDIQNTSTNTASATIHPNSRLHTLELNWNHLWHTAFDFKKKLLDTVTMHQVVMILFLLLHHECIADLQ
jgi:hypothetical protein